ncbi:MAG: hypothetical protein SGJ09_04905, partial [Phycisphaerae bacterium]|nr:hypothetical protein [Phycisphaerae bacterium]
MLREAEIESHLRKLAAELALRGTNGEICRYGGAVMCLAFDARPSTRDVDAIFAPSSEVRNAARVVALRHDLPADWLNDAVKGFVVAHERKVFLDLPNLRIFVPEPEYMLAMKALAARVDASDREDVRFLIRRLALSSTTALQRLKSRTASSRCTPVTITGALSWTRNR